MPTMQPPPTWANPVLVNEQTGKATFHPVWLKWFLELAQTLTAAGAAGGSTVNHNSTSGKQGGNIGFNEFYHLLLGEYESLQQEFRIRTVTTDTQLDFIQDGTVRVTASGKTITLPFANSTLVGRKWTVILGTPGYVDISVRNLADEFFYLPGNPQVVRIDEEGTSLTFKCMDIDHWSIV